ITPLTWSIKSKKLDTRANRAICCSFFFSFTINQLSEIYRPWNLTCLQMQYIQRALLANAMNSGREENRMMSPMTYLKGMWSSAV
ncbi:MAG: hypothetical protein O7D93_00955, partial [Acidobacteria bacterium]|nr:hypothetical protein [Acidobacteriota bacterium]MCZ6879441.1 hypothetical protein [Acidobacteriota bacterium]